MNCDSDTINAEVIAINPDNIKISIYKIEDFSLAETSLKIGSYLQIFDNNNASIIAIIQNYQIEIFFESQTPRRRYIVEAFPIGILYESGQFIRGGDDLAIPPKTVIPASKLIIQKIYDESWKDKEKFTFCSLNREKTIEVPVNGNRLFNKHIAVVGATGSGKSCAIAKIIQTACSLKDSNFSGLNNTHVIIFDIHGEYLTAFPSANIITSSDLILPYWLMNDEEMDELFLEVGDRNNYNQASLLQSIITVNKKESNPTKRVFYDSPCYYDIKKVMQCFRNLQIETICAKDPTRVKIDGVDDRFLSDEEKYLKYSEKSYEFAPQKRDEFKKGSYSDGTIDKFVSRIQSKIANPRLDFIFGEKSRITCFEDVIRKLMGYDKLHLSNVTIFDLSGIPFEVLSITVSLITRLIFDYGYNYRKLNAELNNPFLLIYEEAHRYVPKSELVKYRASRLSIERIAKEGRKYGVTLLISSQRPSEISETIFSQCNNFIVMRISNPDDQNYVKNLLPENLGNIVSSLPSLECGEALLIGDSIIMPSYVYIPKPEPEPFSNDIPFYEKWKMPWAEIPFDKLMNKW